jgi:hypothetical protein
MPGGGPVLSLRAFRLVSPLAAVVGLIVATACEKSSPTEPGGKQTVTINVHAWDFGPGGPVSSPLTLTVGTTYKLVFHNVDGPAVENARHGFTGIPELGLPGTDDIARGGPDFVIDNVTLQPSQRGFYPFSCTNNSCGGDPQQHAGMNGIIVVQ